jgi:hypothetical protein
MANLPERYFGDIRAQDMREIADAMEAAGHCREFLIAQCESRNHREHRGDLWQCVECLRVFCWDEGADDGAFELCHDCSSRVRVRKSVAAFA